MNGLNMAVEDTNVPGENKVPHGWRYLIHKPDSGTQLSKYLEGTAVKELRGDTPLQQRMLKGNNKVLPTIHWASVQQGKNACTHKLMFPCPRSSNLI